MENLKITFINEEKVAQRHFKDSVRCSLQCFIVFFLGVKMIGAFSDPPPWNSWNREGRSHRSSDNRAIVLLSPDLSLIFRMLLIWPAIFRLSPTTRLASPRFLCMLYREGKGEVVLGLLLFFFEEPDISTVLVSSSSFSSPPTAQGYRVSSSSLSLFTFLSPPTTTTWTSLRTLPCN